MQDALILNHMRYWIDAKKQHWCGDCFPPQTNVVLLDVTSTVDDERYEQEERIGIQEG